MTRDIGQRLEADELRSHWELTFATSSRGIAVTDPVSGVIRSVNPAFVAMHGGSAEDFVGQSVAMLLTDEFKARLPQLMAQADTTVHVRTETDHVRLDGSVFPVGAEAYTTYSADGRPLVRVAWFEDLTEKRAVEMARREAEALTEAAFVAAPIGMALVGLDGSWLRVNRALCDLTGYSEADLLQMTFQEITHPDDLDADLAHVEQLLSGEIDRYSMEKRYLTSASDPVWINLSASVIRDARREPLHFVAQIEDISERKRLEASLQRLAERDPLTDLWNRRRFEDELQRQVQRCQRYHERAALLIIDLDDFKPVNDQFGHTVGDELLKAVASSLRMRLRVTDALGRLGGDEFAVILTNITADDGAALAEQLRHAVAASVVRAHGAEVSVAASIGISFLDRHTVSESVSMVDADAAMYDAKARGAGLVRARGHRAETAARLHKARRADAAGRRDRPIRILHCDDSEAYRSLVVEMLGVHDSVEVVAQAADPEQALAAARTSTPDVILLDSSLMLACASLVTQLRDAAPAARIVALSGLEREASSLGTLADTYVHKSASFDALVDAVHNGSTPG